MTLAVLGLGLVSPVGACARDHALFPRAEAPPPWPSPFVLEDDRTFSVAYCPWIQPLDGVAARVGALAAMALDEALSALAAVPTADADRNRLALFVCLPAARADLPEAALAQIASTLGRRAATTVVERRPGAAGAFAALERAAQMIAAGEASGAVVVGADSAVSLAGLTARHARPPSPFLSPPVGPSEGAGAILVAAPEVAGRWKIAPVGEIAEAKTASGRANDENDEVVDGAAMTQLLAALPAPAPFRSVFGQGRVDVLRTRAWESSVARHALRFDPVYFGPSLEAASGAVGAAAGAMHLAFAFASLRHGVAPPAALAPAPFVAWSISRDGLRGAAVGSAGLAPAPELLALAGTPRARRVAREPLAGPDRCPPPGAPLPVGFRFSDLLPPVAGDEPDEDEIDLDAIGDDFVATDEDEALLASEPANDLDPAGDALPAELRPAPPVRLDPALARVLDVAGFHREVVAHCAETAALLARDRVLGPFRAAPEAERRLLCQLDALVGAGPRALEEIAAWWAGKLDDPWKSFAAALAALSFEGADAAAVVARAVQALPEDAGDHAVVLAEALDLSEHPELLPLARELRGHAHPVARAVGVGLLAARSHLLPDEIRAAVTDPHEVVARAGIWAAEPLPVSLREGLARILRDRARDPSPAVAWAAARVLALWGDPETALGFREGGLLPPLGPHALEMFVLLGTPADRERFERALAARPVRAAELSAVARFGHPALVPRLLQHLGDDLLAEPAAAALLTLLGPRVPALRRLDPLAWREALAAQPLDPAARYRRGRPWSAAVVASECDEGDLSRVDLGRRVDELRARLGLREPVALAAFSAAARTSLSGFLATARRKGAEAVAAAG